MRASSKKWDFVAGVVVLTAMILLGFIATPAMSRTNVDVQINVGVPSPVLAFTEEPRVVVVPRTHVLYVEDYPDYDVYCLGRWWYVYREGRWFRGASYRGPWTYIEVRRVPREVVYVPQGYWHERRYIAAEHVPPGQLKKDGGRKWMEKHGNGRGHGRGHGRGWD